MIGTTKNTICKDFRPPYAISTGMPNSIINGLIMWCILLKCIVIFNITHTRESRK